MNIFHLPCIRFYRVLHKNMTYSRLLALSKILPIKNKKIILLGLVPVIPSVYAQSATDIIEVSSSSLKNDTNNEEYKTDKPNDDEKTPWERVKAIYEKDEFGNFSKEMIFTLNACYMAIFAGFIYGGVQRSRVAFVDFMERNQATVFDNHLDAKKKLQNHVTIHFGKGAFYWGWRFTVLTGAFSLVFLSLHAYKGTTSLVDYAVSGAAAGALMRVKFGPPGIIIGGVLGGVLGFISGLGNQTMLNIYGATLDDILATQYEMDRDRSKIFEGVLQRDFEKSSQIPKEAFEMLKTHDNKSKEI